MTDRATAESLTFSRSTTNVANARQGRRKRVPSACPQTSERSFYPYAILQTCLPNVPHFGFGASAMKLGEALDIANRVPEEGVAPKAISLVCGFTPLHLLTYLRAYGRLRFPESGISTDVGLFGDLQGNLQRAAETSVGEIALVLEWSDLDPRLGIR